MTARFLSLRAVACAFWLVAVGAGFAVMLNYQSADGRAGFTPEHWPAQAGLQPDATRATLIMFAHPRCPCTRASLGELNRVLARADGKAVAHVYFFKPADAPGDWSRTDLWRTAAALPGVTVHEDVENAQARLFGAVTSGYVLLYDTHGQLRFKGGITGGRGHAGEDALSAAITGHSANLGQAAVYGCSLLNRCENSPTGGIQ